MIIFNLKLSDLVFKLVNFVDEKGDVKFNKINEISKDDWVMVKSVFVYILNNFNITAQKFRDQDTCSVPTELLKYEYEICQLSLNHLDIKCSFVGVSAHFQEFLALILKLISVNLLSPKNHITGQSI